MQISTQKSLAYAVLLTLLPFLLSGQNIFRPLETVKNMSQQRSKTFVARSMHYELSLSKISNPLAKRNESVVLEIPTLSGTKKIEIEQFQLLSADYQVVNQDGIQESEGRRFRFFKGRVLGKKNSSVGMSLIGGRLHLLIHDEEGTFEIKKVEDGSGLYAGYYTSDIVDKDFIPCESETDNIKLSNEEVGVRSSQALECVEIHLEIDYKAYEKKGSSLSATESWALAILGQVAIFYADSGVPITVSGMKIYTTAESDPYITTSNTAEALSALRSKLNTEGFIGRLAHLMSGRNLGGGRAYLGVLCSDVNNYGVSGNLSSGGTTYSTYTWNINVIAHELGHNFGSPHTHDCAWNGNNTQIDDCGNVWSEENGYGTGSCYDNENKILPGNKATIMSYCHVASGASINLNYGFHQQVRDLIYARYLSTSCGGSEACVGVPPSNDLCENPIRLTPTISCNPKIYDNLYATDSGASPAFSCGNTTANRDVWFVVKIPVNGILTIETRQVASGLSDMVMQVYEGSCGNLIAASCDDNSGVDDHAKVEINRTDLADLDVLIRVLEKNDIEGEFSICTYSALLPCSEIAGELIDFYKATGGPSWTNNSGWADGAANTDCNYCNWFGVTCNNEEAVVAINLPNNNLTGFLDNSLFGLDKLELLDLSANALQGELAQEFVNVLNLRYLYLQSNQFTGTLPSNLASAPKLEQFVGSNNNFSGDLPAFNYSSKITYLNLASNDLSGCYPSGYSRFFSIGEIDLMNNPGLPFNGDFYGFATDYSGFDFDQDGHCLNVTDCQDFNNTIYNGARELCDGLDNNCDGVIDEGMDHGPNIWVGPASDGMWNDSSNWGMQHVPLACEDIEIGMDGSQILIDQSGVLSYLEQTAKSLCIGVNTQLNLESNFYLSVKNGYILNMGILNINSYSLFSDLDSTKSGIINSGVLNIDSRSYVSLRNSGINGIHNKPGGVINNYGTVIVDSNHPITGNAGILNEHIINNFGRIEIIGDFKMLEMLNKSGALFNNEGDLRLGGDSFAEEGN